jgi:mono/diheme cytochrome c family protein
MPMSRRIAMVIWMSLVWPGCGEVDRRLPAEYRGIEVPAPWLASADARTRGAALFRESCALCHGERGDGRGIRREGLTTQPRDFTSRDWRASTSPRRVFFAIREGLHGTAMPSWKAFSEQDSWALTAYVLALGEGK